MASTRRQFSSLFTVVALLVNVFPNVHAQGTNATCEPGFEWMTNSRSQNACLVTAYLNTPCLVNPADAYVYSLPPGFHYRPPLASSATSCQCNTIFYSVMQACAVCQGDPIVPWSTWNANCTSAIYESVYPEPIPAGTSIPSWAYLDVHTSDNFNVTAAQLEEQKNHPESSAGGPTPTLGGPGSNTTNSPNTSSSSKHSNTGAIVGGVVGGIGGAVILAAIAFFFWRRHQRSASAKSNALSASSNVFPPVSPFDPNEKAGQPYPNLSSANIATPIPVSSPTPAPGFNSAGIGAGYTPVRIYDPNDPSTFPTGDPSLRTAQSPTMYDHGSPILYPSNPAQYQHHMVTPHNGQYTGAPEV